MGHHVIYLGVIEQVLVMNDSIMILGYTYAERKLKNLPDIFCKILHIRRLIAWITSRLAWTLTIRGRD